jgi:hypothetical protein
LKHARPLLIAALLLGALTACADNSPPEGCPDTAPDAVSGLVSGKQVDESKPAIVASNGDQCWHLVISNRTLSNYLISVYVDKRAYDAVKVGDSFKREKLKAK